MLSGCARTRQVNKRIAELSLLRVVNFGHNMLQSLPAMMFGGEILLKHIKELYLHNNDFTMFPHVVCEMVTLEKLSLAHNAMVTIPDTIKNLTSLTVVNISHNKLSSVPQGLGAC